MSGENIENYKTNLVVKYRKKMHKTQPSRYLFMKQTTISLIKINTVQQLNLGNFEIFENKNAKRT